MGWTAWSQKVPLIPRLRGGQFLVEWHTCLDTELCLAPSYVHVLLLLIKLLNNLSPFRRYRKQAMNSVMENAWNSGSCGGRDGVVPWRRSSSGTAVAVESGSVHL